MAQATTSPFPFARTLLCLSLLAAMPAVAQDDDILVPDDAPAAPTKARAKVGFVSLVPVGDANTAIAEQVGSALRKELSESFEWVSLSLPSAKGTKAPPALGPAEDLAQKGAKNLEAGRRFLEKLSFGRASANFEAAISNFRGAAAALEDVAPVIAAFTGLAEVHMRRGEEAQAKEALTAIARLDPEHELDASRYPPLFLQTHWQVRDAVMAESKAAVVVDRSATGGRVFIDGRAVGDAPVTVKGLPAGEHFVRVVKDGQGTFGAVVKVAAGEETTVSPGFMSLDAQGPLELLALNRFHDVAAAAVAAEARAKGVAVAVVGVVGRSTTGVPTALVAIEASSGRGVRVPVLAFDGDLLNIAIEALKAREKINDALKARAIGEIADDVLLSDVPSASSVEMGEFVMRYEVKAAPAAPRRSRLIGAKEEPATEGVAGDGRAVLSAGDEGSRLSMRDDKTDRLGNRRERQRSAFVAEDVPLTARPWFWPTAITGGVVGTVLLTGGALTGLVAAGVVPDPRGRSGMRVTVELPE
ncbi:MAG: PEGA domain-containing protein [Myxococcota bacterium]